MLSASKLGLALCLVNLAAVTVAAPDDHETRTITLGDALSSIIQAHENNHDEHDFGHWHPLEILPLHDAHTTSSSAESSSSSGSPTSGFITMVSAQAQQVHHPAPQARPAQIPVHLQEPQSHQAAHLPQIARVHRQVPVLPVLRQAAHLNLRHLRLLLHRHLLHYIDLFLIHDPYSGTLRRLETYRALVEAKAAGKIRSVGVSNYGVKHMEELRKAGLEMPAVNQIELHPLCQQKPIVEYCRENSIVVQAYSPLLRGKMDHHVFQTIAKKHTRDPAQILIRWSLQKGFVPLPKSASSARIHSNAQLFDFELDEDDMVRLDALDLGKEGAITWNPVDAE
ncbi:hypothetical protein D9758_001949 [Tetrapyrgos nigripes]|uniref:NADP-dependent oxidoreductase domain-containing protein n=1 Tax=Tetrapyrgos nigripes TaxID=182062 RepID=A0A8H5GT45_9AGAR|nr:hypothetical protein D9758_001949 [Tetrapyrgos nigripes]